MRAPRTSAGGHSPSNVRRGERIARPLRKPGRIRREAITTEYRPDRHSDAETQTIRPGDAFRRQGRADDTPRYYLYLGVSAEDSSCMYMYELGPDKSRGSVGFGLPELIDRRAWLTDYENGHSDYERVPLETAVEQAHD